MSASDRPIGPLKSRAVGRGRAALPGPWWRIGTGGRARLSRAFLALSLLAAACPASLAFERAIEAPPVVVSVPGLPDVPVRDSAGATRGRSGALAVEIAAAPSPDAGSTRACAGAFLRELVRRPDLPDRDAIYRAPLDVSTFLVLYVLEGAGRQVLHAHVLAAAAGTHCVDAHFSRDVAAGEDIDGWRTAFVGARIRDRTR